MGLRELIETASPTSRKIVAHQRQIYAAMLRESDCLESANFADLAVPDLIRAHDRQRGFLTALQLDMVDPLVHDCIPNAQRIAQLGPETCHFHHLGGKKFANLFFARVNPDRLVIMHAVLSHVT